MALWTESVWAAGEHGLVQRWDGTRWFVVKIGSQQDLVALSGTSPSDIWAAGHATTVAHFNGSAWTVEDLGSLYKTSAFCATAPDDAWLIDSNDDVYLVQGAGRGRVREYRRRARRRAGRCVDRRRRGEPLAL